MTKKTEQSAKCDDENATACETIVQTFVPLTQQDIATRLAAKSEMDDDNVAQAPPAPQERDLVGEMQALMSKQKQEPQECVMQHGRPPKDADDNDAKQRARQIYNKDAKLQQAMISEEPFVTDCAVAASKKNRRSPTIGHAIACYDQHKSKKMYTVSQPKKQEDTSDTRASPQNLVRGASPQHLVRGASPQHLVCGVTMSPKQMFEKFSELEPAYSQKREEKTRMLPGLDANQDLHAALGGKTASELYAGKHRYQSHVADLMLQRAEATSELAAAAEKSNHSDPLLLQKIKERQMFVPKSVGERFNLIVPAPSRVAEKQIESQEQALRKQEVPKMHEFKELTAIAPIGEDALCEIAVNQTNHNNKEKVKRHNSKRKESRVKTSSNIVAEVRQEQCEKRKVGPRFATQQRWADKNWRKQHCREKREQKQKAIDALAKDEKDAVRAVRKGKQLWSNATWRRMHFEATGQRERKSFAKSGQQKTLKTDKSPTKKSFQASGAVNMGLQIDAAEDVDVEEGPLSEDEEAEFAKMLEQVEKFTENGGTHHQRSALTRRLIALRKKSRQAKENAAKPKQPSITAQFNALQNRVGILEIELRRMHSENFKQFDALQNRVAISEIEQRRLRTEVQNQTK